MRRVLPAAVALVCVTGLAACGDDSDAAEAPASTPTAAGSAGSAGSIDVVTATDVYGDIVQKIGGDRVTVHAIIAGSSAADPHSYEATSRDQLAVSDADLVVANGGHYDEFLTRLLSAVGGERRVVTAVEAFEADHGGADEPTPTATAEDDEHADDEHADDEHADDEHAEDEHAEDEPSDEDGHEHSGDANEHVWYDLHAMEVVAEEITEALSEIAPEGRESFEHNAEEFLATLDEIIELQDEIRADFEGRSVAVTEAVPLYLLEDAGLVNATPAEFSQSIEEGTDVPVRVLQDTLALFSEQSVELLVYNDQTTGPQTEQVREAAEDADIPVVAVSETLPEGKDYLSWMRENLEAIRSALTTTSPSA